MHRARLRQKEAREFPSARAASAATPSPGCAGNRKQRARRAFQQCGRPPAGARAVKRQKSEDGWPSLAPILYDVYGHGIGEKKGGPCRAALEKISRELFRRRGAGA